MWRIFVELDNIKFYVDAADIGELLACSLENTQVESLGIRL